MFSVAAGHQADPVVIAVPLATMLGIMGIIVSIIIYVNKRRQQNEYYEEDYELYVMSMPNIGHLSDADCTGYRSTITI